MPGIVLLLVKGVLGLELRSFPGSLRNLTCIAKFRLVLDSHIVGLDFAVRSWRACTEKGGASWGKQV